MAIKQRGIGRRHGEQGILRYTHAQHQSSVAVIRECERAVAVSEEREMAKVMVAALKLWRRLPWGTPTIP
jgi:hypothetical protein